MLCKQNLNVKCIYLYIPRPVLLFYYTTRKEEREGLHSEVSGGWGVSNIKFTQTFYLSHKRLGCLTNFFR